MAQSAFAAGGGNAKMAQLKKLQANRNLSPAALRKLVEQIGRRALQKSPGAFSVAAQPRKGKGGTTAKTETSQSQSKPGVNKGPGRVRPTTPYYGPGGDPSGSGQGQAQQKSKPKPKPKPEPTPVKPKPKPQPTAAKPKPKPQPTSAKPKPKPAPTRSSTYSQAAMMKDIRATDRAAARSKELKKLQELREEAKKKSLEQAKKNRARGQRRGGPRG